MAKKSQIEETTEEEETEDAEETAPAKPSFVKALIGAVAQGAALGAVALAAVYLAPIGAPAVDGASQIADAAYEDKKAEHDKSSAQGDKPAPYNSKSGDDDVAAVDVAIVNLEPLVVTLGPRAKATYLKISISLETKSGHEETVNALTPRFRDVLNTYLRAVDENDLADPASMTRLRAQILRRIQLVADSDIVTGILITDFILT